MQPIFSSAAQRFLEALVNKDFSAIERCFATDIKFRALIPPGVRTAVGAGDVATYFRRWFGDCDVVELISSELSDVGGRNALSYLLHLREAGDWYMCRQHMFFTARENDIDELDLLCSGFQRAAVTE